MKHVTFDLPSSQHVIRTPAVPLPSPKNQKQTQNNTEKREKQCFQSDDLTAK